MTQPNLHNLPAILNALDEAYPDSECALHFDGVYQLIIAVILSAQCTDKMVNQVTPALFERVPRRPGTWRTPTLKSWSGSSTEQVSTETRRSI